MTITNGFLFIFLAIVGWISACFTMDYIYPKQVCPVELCWYGDIHIGVEHPNPAPEWPEDRGR